MANGIPFLICLCLLGGRLWAAEPIRDGVVSYYDAKGRLFETVEYRYGRPNGHFRTFYPDGRLMGWGSFSNGKLEGMAQGYYPSGRLRFKSFYSNGQLHGMATLYWADGEPKTEITYIHGVQDGVAREYDMYGRPIAEYQFAGGQEKLKKEFYPDYMVQREQQAKDGAVQGLIYREYREDGTLRKVMEVPDGNKWETFDP